MKKLLHACAVLLVALPTPGRCETVGVFFARDTAPIEFAAGEVKAMKAAPHAELGATLDNIKAISYLTI